MTVEELLSDPSHWTKGAAARTKYGEACCEESSEAVSWCIIGAIHKCYSQTTTDPVVLCERVRDYVEKPLIDFNDAPERTHEEIMAVVRKLGI